MLEYTFKNSDGAYKPVELSHDLLNKYTALETIISAIKDSVDLTPYDILSKDLTCYDLMENYGAMVRHLSHSEKLMEARRLVSGKRGLAKIVAGLESKGVITEGELWKKVIVPTAVLFGGDKGSYGGGGKPLVG